MYEEMLGSFILSLGSPGAGLGAVWQVQESFVRAGCCVASAGVPLFAVRGWGGFGWLMFEEVSGAQTSARTAQACGPDGPYGPDGPTCGPVARTARTCARTARTARTCGPDGRSGRHESWLVQEYYVPFSGRGGLDGCRLKKC